MTATEHPLRLWVDASRCIGCLACSISCESGRIRVSDEAGTRTVRFEQDCTEADCNRCARSCQEGAITLEQRLPEAAREVSLVLTFELARCADCGVGFTTRPILEALRRIVASSLASPSEDLFWLRLCPACRRKNESREQLQRGRRANPA